MKQRLQSVVDELVASGDAVAAAAVVGSADAVWAEVRAGFRDPGRSRRLGRWNRFDLASLTKPWLATLALVDDDELPLSTPLGDLLGATSDLWRDCSLESLLRHRSGLPAWRPLYRMARTPEAAMRRLAAIETTARVPTYSDLGFILYARAAADAFGEPIEMRLLRRVAGRLGLRTVGSRPPASTAVACPLTNAVEVELAREAGFRVAAAGSPEVGIVQDGNARFLGGVAGHAGLFAPARALWRLGAEWLRPGRLLMREQVERALSGPGRYRLGWWRPGAAKRATRALGRESFGHHGFTGGSLWVDPEAGCVLVLLAHRSSVDVDMDRWRNRFHRTALA